MRRTSGSGGWCYVESVDGENDVTTTPLSAGDGTWSNGDTYEMLSLVQGYDDSDTVYVPYISEIATTTEIEVNVLYVGAKNVIIRARNVDDVSPIQEFQTTSAIGTGGMNVSVTRNDDDVYS
jgi:hypothetical protein